MSPGPLRRITAVIGLLSLAPIAAMVLTDALTPEQAAIRAVIVVTTVVVVGNLARIVLTGLLHRVEREVTGVDRVTATSAGSPAATPTEAGDRQRRRDGEQLEARPAT